ncbi:hypothetical protein [Klebsiella oxytoca]|uniref:Uncharacterized protein n=1 Tax=Klebsiella oxytoca TaxID=571 RepID=A0AAD3UH45_KLEOX|nr:hypothetical protein [Klebsiella oxytoca]ELT9681864.1 hypothetical protein [Klebsiella oxytoca]ELT9975484.1 hypothetical protein [Klebsiella oxytoca]MBL6085494.1 hypothetical protein [Klebsiella oxytoca]MBL6252119.1 hypothetical protein [Klebsiella oxytoca]MBL6269524.1 hypothetical protein [Klebsiella oxytoca]
MTPKGATKLHSIIIKEMVPANVDWWVTEDQHSFPVAMWAMCDVHWDSEEEASYINERDRILPCIACGGEIKPRASADAVFIKSRNSNHTPDYSGVSHF